MTRDFIDLLPKVAPFEKAKKAATPWDGSAGVRARSKGIKSEEQFAVFSLIEAEAQKKSSGAYLSDGEIARRTKMAEPFVRAIVQDLLVRGVVRANSGLLGLRALVPVGN